MRWFLGTSAGLVILAIVGVSGCATLLPPDLTPPPQSDIVISGVTIINPGVERLVDRTVIIHDGRIFSVRPRLADDPPPLCPGCFAIPGLIDAHVHTPPRIAFGNQRLFALMYLAYGVTSVRDMGQSEDSVATFASALNRGEIVGPHMYRCGPILDGDPPGWPAALKVVTAAEGTAAVARLASEGVDCIKVYNEVNRRTYDAIAAEAARHGLPLLGHVPHAVTLRHLYDFEAQHLTGMPYLTQPRPPTGMDVRSEDLLAMTDMQVDQALDIVVEHRVALTPTIINPLLRLIASDPVRFAPTAGSRILPMFWLSAWNMIAQHPDTPDAIATALAAAPRMRRIVALARQRGVDVLAGTDTLMPWVIPGEALQLEIDQLAIAFGDREAALAAATTINGRHIAPGQIGVIAQGARADLLLLASDPTMNLSALRDWKVEIANGRRYDRKTVDGWVELYRHHFHGYLYEHVMAAIFDIAARQYDQNPHGR